jgi:hypothetical protein
VDTNEKLFNQAVAWLRENVTKNSYGSVGLTLHVHAGEIRKVTKMIEESEK